MSIGRAADPGFLAVSPQMN